MANQPDTRVTAFWQDFLTAQNLPDSTPYKAWSFGSNAKMADELLALVIAGDKQATASYYDSYIAASEPLPQAGEYSVLLDGRDEPRAVILTKHVEMVPFNRVSQAHAYLEGEGDQTLEYWLDVHRNFFSAEAKTYGLKYFDTSLVVFEIFACIYQK